MAVGRKYPVGAELRPGHGVHFRTWAPAARSVSVEIFADAGDNVLQTVPLTSEPAAPGYFSGIVPEPHGRAGARYKLRLDGRSFPDPVSRWQPDGPHGVSVVVNPSFPWTDQAWRGRPAEELVIYELHLGTFTREGTWQAAMAELPELARIGITMIEVMPIAEFPGKFGWGYDGVSLFAPTRLYGTPDDVRAFIDRAHALGVMVVLDVVYNHLGPDGNYLREFSPDYFSTRHRNEWGEPLNFDAANAGPVREFFASNARYWIDAFHFDGLRLDATQQMFDASDVHMIAEVARAARAGAPNRRIFLIGESETQEARCVREPATGGYGLDALWNDDFHHAALVCATGRAEAYYRDYRGTAQEFVSAAKYGFLFQGQWYHWQQKRRGQPALDLPRTKFIHFLQNHDQVANSLDGRRLAALASPAMTRALTAVLLLQPSIPLLFQGQEFAASSPFVYFADHRAELHAKVFAGRRAFLRQFRSVATPDATARLPDPADPATFARCRLDFGERERHAAVYRLHEDLLRIRREERVLTRPARLDGAVLGPDAFVLRFFSPTGDDCLLVVNLGADLAGAATPEPLLAPPDGRGWRIRWSSEALDYGGGGTPPLETRAGWMIPGRSAVLLSPHEDRDLPALRLSEKD